MKTHCQRCKHAKFQDAKFLHRLIIENIEYTLFLIIDQNRTTFYGEISRDFNLSYLIQWTNPNNKRLDDFYQVLVKMMSS